MELLKFRYMLFNILVKLNFYQNIPFFMYVHMKKKFSIFMML